jgi:hypothetical protein
MRVPPRRARPLRLPSAGSARCRLPAGAAGGKGSGALWRPRRALHRRQPSAGHSDPLGEYTVQENWSCPGTFPPSYYAIRSTAVYTALLSVLTPGHFL